MKEGWIADNVQVAISQQWLGGEIWHAWFAARARMLEYTLELESKIAEGKLAGENTLFVLALCGDGFLAIFRDDVPVDGAWIEMLVEGVLRRRVVVGHPEFVHKRIAGNLI